MAWNLTVVQLKELLRERDFQVSGNKSELIQRLKIAYPKGEWQAKTVEQDERMEYMYDLNDYHCIRRSDDGKVLEETRQRRIYCAARSSSGLNKGQGQKKDTVKEREIKLIKKENEILRRELEVTRREARCSNGLGHTIIIISFYHSSNIDITIDIRINETIISN